MGNAYFLQSLITAASALVGGLVAQGFCVQHLGFDPGWVAPGLGIIAFVGVRKVEVLFRFKSNESGSDFQCNLDGDGFKACDSPRKYKVRHGDHTFKVRAVAGGLTDPTPARFEFTVRD